jgi:hypothetical protein
MEIILIILTVNWIKMTYNFCMSFKLESYLVKIIHSQKHNNRNFDFQFTNSASMLSCVPKVTILGLKPIAQFPAGLCTY